MQWTQSTPFIKIGRAEVKDLLSHEQTHAIGKAAWLAEIRSKDSEAYDAAYGPGKYSEMKRREFFSENATLRAAKNKVETAKSTIRELERELYEVKAPASHAQGVEEARLAELAEAQKRATAATAARKEPEAKLATIGPALEKKLAAARKQALELAERAVKVEAGVRAEFDEIMTEVERQKAEAEAKHQRLLATIAEREREGATAEREVRERDSRAEEDHLIGLGEKKPGVFARLGAVLGLAAEPEEPEAEEPAAEPAAPPELDTRPREVGGALAELNDKPARRRRE
jgi:hypothetical protein